MYITSDVDLPEELLTAQRDGKLVVFAGAGVSMGPPSNLPSFSELADQVGGTTAPHSRNEAFDRYFGRLESMGWDLQSLVCDIIDSPASQPNRLHELLVALFDGVDSIRLVTTNFDRHFTTVVGKSSSPSTIYYAPALPIGRELDGLVYLHGAVEDPRKRVIISDSDFGRAYLTDGWATRFLADLFQAFTVLFVGYSHEDTVMQYLARGLPPETARYALTLPDFRERWIRHGIQPIDYPERESPNKHAALVEALEQWVKLALLGTLGHDDRIRQIVSGSPPVERDTAEYISSIFQEIPRLRSFAKHARSQEWLAWTEERGALDQLFKADRELLESEAILAEWFANNFALQDPLALEIVSANGSVLSPRLWLLIALRLAYTTESRPSADILSCWLSILLQHPPHGLVHHLTPVLEGHRHPDDLAATTLLLQGLMKPRLVFDQSLGAIVTAGEDDPVRLRAEASVEIDEHSFEKAWKEALSANLSSLNEPIADAAATSLAQAHLLMTGIGAADDFWDAMSFRRSSIEPHPQDPTAMRRPIDWGIDAARDSLGWQLQNNHRSAMARIRLWRSSRAPLLRRLAINGMANDPRCHPDQALQEIIDSGWLYASPLKHEVFGLLKTVFPRAGEEERREFIRGSMEATSLSDEGQDAAGRETNAYERYNLAVWLCQVAPQCEIAREHLDQVQEEHLEFGPRDHPDFGYWAGPVTTVVARSPKAVDELLDLSVADALELLEEFDEVDWRGPTREGLMGTLREAASSDVNWALELLEETVDRDSQSDIWQSLLAGLKEAELEESHWDILLTVLAQLELEHADRAACKLMVKGLEQGELSPRTVSAVESIADRLFAAADSRDGPEAESLPERWFDRAINDVGGDIADVWLQALSCRRAAVGADWDGLNTEDRQRLNRAITAESRSGQLCRVVLASQLAFLFSIDEEWATTELLPCFNWDRSPVAAEQAWHGFLAAGRLSVPVVEHLMPHLEASFPRIDHELAPYRDAFCQRLAAIAIHPEARPVEDGWLYSFLLDVSEETRVVWADQVGRQLDAIPEEAAASAWDRWIRTYWHQRANGVPRPIDSPESTATVGWIFGLRSVFAAAAAAAARFAASISGDRRLLFRLKQSDLPEAESEAFTELFAQLLECTDELQYECRFAEEITQRLIAAGVSRALLLRICERLAVLGCDTDLCNRTLRTES